MLIYFVNTAGTYVPGIGEIPAYKGGRGARDGASKELSSRRYGGYSV